MSFYRDLTKRSQGQQLVIFENEEPSTEIQSAITFHQFTGDPTIERCGFFPKADLEESSNPL
jgi:hypothetical protein